MLHVGIRIEIKAIRSLPFGVKFNQILCDILYPLLGFAFQLVPGIGSQFVERWHRTFLADIFRDAVQRMNAHIKNIVVLINQSDGLLLPAIVFYLLQTVEPPHPMVDMRHIITWLQVINLFHGDGLLAGKAITNAVFMITVENLVVGIAGQLIPPVDKAFMQ